MELLLKRIALKDTYTIGKLFLNGKYFCDTLEDPNRDKNKNGQFDNGEAKVHGDTAIPYGKYEVILNVSPKFKRLLPRLVNVPSFDGILIHRGNTPKDTHGCILVGENKVVGQVINSTKYEEELVRILSSLPKGEKIKITIE